MNKVEQHILEAIESLNSGNERAAKSHYNKAREASNCSARDRQLLDIVGNAVGDMAVGAIGADKIFRRARMKSSTKQLKELCASILYKRKQVEKAKLIYEDVVAGQDISVDVLIRAAIFYRENKDTPAALACANRVIAIEEYNVAAYYEKGMALYQSGCIKDAVKALTKSLEIDSTCIKCACSLSRILCESGDVERAFNTIADQETNAKSNEDVVSLWRVKGYIFASMHKNQEAIDEHRKAYKIAKHSDKYYICKDIASCYSKMKNHEQALFWVDSALAIKPRGHEALRDKGIILYKTGKLKEAIEYYENALNINPSNHLTLKWYGITLSQCGKEREAIDKFEAALQVKPDSYSAMRGLALSYLVIGEDDNAVKYAQMAVETGPHDFLNHASSAFIYANLARYDDSIRSINKCLGLSESVDMSLLDNEVPFIYEFVRERLRRVGREQDIASLSSQEIGPGALYAVITDIQNESLTLRNKLADEKRKAERRLDDFLSKSTIDTKGSSVFAILRRWNSFTPTVQSVDVETVGGGYYINQDGLGVVIDPGHDFIRNFIDFGGKITDIHRILVTHAHDDHTSSLEAILTLLHQYNKRYGYHPSDTNFHSVVLYMNVGSIFKYSGLINLRNSPYIRDLVSLVEGNEYNIGNGLHVLVVPAFHDELVTTTRAVGLYFTSPGVAGAKSILLTSDTALFSLERSRFNVQHGMADMQNVQIGSLYSSVGVKNVDLLIAHIGSVLEREISGRIAPYNWQAHLYSNHLGIIGTAHLVCQLRPAVVAVSEFGEELRAVRPDIISLLGKVTEIYMRSLNLSPPLVFGGDIGFVYDMVTGDILELHSESFYKPSRLMSYYAHDRFYCVQSGKSTTELNKECTKGASSYDYFKQFRREF